MNTISHLWPRAAHEMAGWLQVIDVREPYEFNGPLGHIPGSVLRPLRTVPGGMAAFDSKRPVLAVSRSGQRSERAARRLAAAGFAQVATLSGGLRAWNQAGLPVLRDEPSTLEELRDVLHTWLAGASALSRHQVLPAFRWLCEARGGSFERPTAASLARVIDALKALANKGGSSPTELNAYVQSFHRSLALL